MTGFKTLFARRVSRPLASLHSLLRLASRDVSVFQTVQRVRRDNLTFLGYGALADLALAMLDIEKNQVQGLLVETGCALGGSAIVMATAKRKQRPFFVYDTFEMIPSPGSEDGKDAHQRYKTIREGNAKGFSGNTYYGYLPDLYSRVVDSFRSNSLSPEENNILFFRGVVETTMSIDQPVALAHIDCDWYSPVMTSLQQIVPHLSRGGYLIVDDYYQWSGARKAVDEFFAGIPGDFEFVHRSRLQIRKIS